MKTKNVLLFSLLVAPCLLIFNGNLECWFYNVIGLVYTYWLVKTLKKTCD